MCDSRLSLLLIRKVDRLTTYLLHRNCQVFDFNVRVHPVNGNNEMKDSVLKIINLGFFHYKRYYNYCYYLHVKTVHFSAQNLINLVKIYLQQSLCTQMPTIVDLLYM